VAYGRVAELAEWQMCPLAQNASVSVTRLAARWLHTVEAEKPAQICGHPERVQPTAETATSLTRRSVFRRRSEHIKAGRETSIRRESENLADEARSDLAFATTMFRALENIVLWSTECSVHYYSIVAVDKTSAW